MGRVCQSRFRLEGGLHFDESRINVRMFEWNVDVTIEDWCGLDNVFL